MALTQPPLLTHGGTHSARAFRMMIRNLAAGAAGINEGTDLKATPLPTPGAGIQVGDGSAIIRGAAWGQGSYTQHNVGPAEVPIAPTGGSERSDLVCLRVEDPEYEGTRDPATDDIGYFHVVSNVSPTTTQPPAGMTAVPLARLDLPANTSIVTAAMIKDLRQIANPRRDRRLHSAYPSSLDELPVRVGQWVTWPPQARWTIDVPAWAARCILTVTIGGLRLTAGNIWTSSRAVFGERQGQVTSIDDNQTGANRRATEMIADTFSVPAAYRGTSRVLYLQMYHNRAEDTGRISVNGSTSIVADLEFTEGVM